MSRVLRRVLSPSTIAIVSLVLATPTRAGAQGAGPVTAADSAFVRARQLVANGNGAAGRLLVDSMIAAAMPGSPDYAEALYWRANLAVAGGDSERDYRRIVVEYPASPRAADALLQLAQLEMARGDRAAAMVHLERFMMENPNHPDRARTGLTLVRLAFDMNDAPRACLTLGRTLQEVPAESVELRNQLTYYSPRCASVDTTRATRVAGADSAVKRDTTRRVAATPKPVAKTRYTIQVCACATRTLAERYLAQLQLNGFDARLVGKAKPFRVRVGEYDTRSAANAVAAKLKAHQFAALVTVLGVEK
jgi:cell division septation protein DedD